MFPRALRSVLLLSAGLRSILAQTSSTACNNSPDLCSRQYNNVTYLGAHNSPFLRDYTTGFSTSGNQFYNTTLQLQSGVRLVTGQVQNPNGTTDLHVCHSSCELLDAGTLTSWLSEIKTWMDSNPNDVVTILLVNGAGSSASELASAYTSSGLADYAYTPATSAATTTWPTLQSLISNGTRAMNFVATLGDNSDATYLMNEFVYIFENDYDNSEPTDFSCEVNRPSTLLKQTNTAISSGYLPLMNHFLYGDQLFGIQSPNESYANVTNGATGLGNLATAASKCSSLYGRAPTFLLVDFTNMGPAIDTVDSLNGVSDPTGRTALPSEALSESSGAAVLLPGSSALWLKAGAALLVVFLL